MAIGSALANGDGKTSLGQPTGLLQIIRIRYRIRILRYISPAGLKVNGPDSMVVSRFSQYNATTCWHSQFGIANNPELRRQETRAARYREFVSLPAPAAFDAGVRCFSKQDYHRLRG